MTALTLVCIVFTVFIALLVLGMAIPFAIGIPAAVYLVLYGGLPALKGLGLMSWGSLNSFTLTAIPLFILMAEIIQRGGLSQQTYRGLANLVARFPGGLLQTNIASCAVFAAVNGSSVATAATIGSVAIPELKRRGYSQRLSLGSLAAGGTLGILIPPSIIMIVYASFTETSVAKLFMAGVVPGLLLTAMFMTYIALHAIVRPRDISEKPIERTPVLFLRSMGDLLPFAGLIFGTMGMLYFGWATPTEAAALGCLLSIVFSRIWGTLSWSTLREALRNTVRIVGGMLFLVYAAFIFAYAISVAGAGEQLTSFVVGLKLSKADLIIALFVLYLVLGCLVEGLGMIVITVPLLYPVLVSYGIDLVWFGILLVVFVEAGQITPPIGINLFVIHSVSKADFSDILIGTIPFLICMLVLLVLLVQFPSLALWLPEQMFGPSR